MAILYADAVEWGNVVKTSLDNEYPCYDTNYTVAKLSFTIDKTFATYAAMIAFEKTTIPSHFSDREKDLTYAGSTFVGYILQEFKRNEKILANNDGTWASYDVVFVKDGA